MSLCAEPSKQAQTEDLGRKYDNTGKNEPCLGHSLDVTAQMLSSWVPVVDGCGQEMFLEIYSLEISSTPSSHSFIDSRLG